MKYLLANVNQNVLPPMVQWTHLDRLILMAKLSEVPQSILAHFFTGIQHASYSDHEELNGIRSFYRHAEVISEYDVYRVIFKYDLKNVIKMEQQHRESPIALLTSIFELEVHEKIGIYYQICNDDFTQSIEVKEEIALLYDDMMLGEPATLYHVAAKAFDKKKLYSGKYYYSVSKEKFIEISIGEDGFEDYPHAYYALKSLFRMQAICYASEQYTVLEIIHNMIKEVSKLVNKYMPADGYPLRYEHQYQSKAYKAHDRIWLNTIYKIM